MNLHFPTLLLAAAIVTALVTLVMSLVAFTQRIHRGYKLWLLAQWLGVAGLMLQVGPSGPPLQKVLADLLVLQWPIVTLIGMRRFNARQPLAGGQGADVVLLALAAVLSLAVRFTHPVEWQPAYLNLISAVLTGCAAAILLSAGSFRESAALRLLAACLGTSAALLCIGALLGFGGLADVSAAPALATAMLSTAMGFVALLLTHERTVRELRESRRRLRFLANIDMLTQVPNRRHFGELARRMLQRSADRAAAVLMFDVDHFKRINDELGHAAGDRALRVVSRCVQDTLRANDVAGRHGGDEFVLMLPDTSMRDAMAVATRIVRRAQELARAQSIPDLSLSFGVVEMRSDESLDEAMRRADQALYEAKRQGRGRAVSAAGDEQRPVFVESRRLGLTAL